MKSLLTSIILLLFSIGINAQSIADFDDATIYLSGIFGVTSTLDEYGNVFLDISGPSGATSQYKFRITDVTFSMQEKTLEPPIVIIDFTCRKTECISSDTAFGAPPTQTGTITLDAKRGKKAYNFLINLQEFIKNS